MTARLDATTANKPVQRFRSGAIEVPVSLKTGEKGPFYSVTMSRWYKSGEDWKQADSFSGDDVIVLTELLDVASTSMLSQPTKQAA
jgi:hypothetical protein